MRQKYKIVFFHFLFWMFIMIPVVFVPHPVAQNTTMYMLRLYLPLMMCLSFYLNYLWIMPAYYLKGHIKTCLLINIVIILLFSILNHWAVMHLHHLEAQMGYAPPRVTKAINPGNLFFFIIRDIVPITLSVVVATLLRLSIRWQKAEKARTEAEAQKAEAELQNLRNQINPHFLLNTLNNIYALVNFDTNKAQRAILALSNMLRQMLYGAQGRDVSLKDEIDFIENYIKLMRLRLSDNVKIDFNIDTAGHEDVRIAPFILISLVENAFKHGISTTMPSFVSLSVVANDKQRIFEITNSNYPKNDTDKSGHGIGLEQVQKRLDLAYSGRYKWTRGVDKEANVYRSRIEIFV
ncbi:MAG: sensor histidine kinase [Prevotella sp.]